MDSIWIKLYFCTGSLNLDRKSWEFDLFIHQNPDKIGRRFWWQLWYRYGISRKCNLFKQYRKVHPGLPKKMTIQEKLLTKIFGHGKMIAW